MSPLCCPLCGRGNPADARFCNRCGAQLDLHPCPHCGSINEVGASRCHECDGGLAGAETGDAEPAGRGHARAYHTPAARAEQRLELFEKMLDAPAVAPTRAAKSSSRRPAAPVAILAALGLAIAVDWLSDVKRNARR